MATPFPVIEVSPDTDAATETLGTKRKFWFYHPELGRCLYKQARQNTGEDWAEKIASELCELLGLPHACYELATWNGAFGTVSPSFVPVDGTLILGNDILVQSVPEYPQFQAFNVSQHTLDIVLAAIDNNALNLPLDWTPQVGIDTALDTFVGYLLLDAWIGNTDRHHENWGFIEKHSAKTSLFYLAPTYDLASCLGRELLDNKRQERINNNAAIAAYIAKCRSALYDRVEDKKAMFTLDVFQSTAQRHTKAALVWLDRLANISLADTRVLFERIPQDRISFLAIEFAQQILEINQSRLLKLREELS